MSAVLPNFLIYGAGKAGTTALWFQMDEHPEVFFPRPKEQKFFSQSFNDKRGADAYAAAFADWSGQPAIGEATPYLGHSVAHKVAAVVPDAKLIISLRDPVDRAFSSYRNQLAAGAERPGTTFLEALDKTPLYTTIGQYGPQLRQVFDHFPRERVKVFLFPELRERPQELYDEICDFVGIGRVDLKGAGLKRANVSGESTKAWVPWLLHGMYAVYRGALRSPARRVVDNRVVAPRLRQLRTRVYGIGLTNDDETPKKARITAEERAAAVVRFRESNALVAELLDRDLSAWDAV